MLHMNNNKLSIIGIRSKSTKNTPTYFFSIESKDIEFLRHVEDLVKQTLWVYGIEINHEARCHD